MALLTIEIRTVCEYEGPDIARNLRAIADHLADVQYPVASGVIRNVNGNRVGSWSVVQ